MEKGKTTTKKSLKSLCGRAKNLVSLTIEVMKCLLEHIVDSNFIHFCAL